MDYAGVAILGIIVGILLKKTFENKRILELEQENLELQIWKNSNKDTVEKNIELNRRIRNIRTIITKHKQKNEFQPFTISEIEKELSMNR